MMMNGGVNVGHTGTHARHDTRRNATTHAHPGPAYLPRDPDLRDLEKCQEDRLCVHLT
jgi:hypothetical protein